MRANAGDIDIAFESAGSGECVLFLHAIGPNRSVWRNVANRLEDGFYVVVCDLRGPGDGSGSEEKWTLGTFASDPKGLLDHLGAPSRSLVGLPLGGMVAQTFELLLDRTKTVEERGTRAIVELTIERWFTPEFVRRSPEVVKAVRTELFKCLAETSARATRAIADLDLWDGVGSIQASVPVTTGARDPSTAVDVVRRIHQRIEGSKPEVIPGASFMVPFEQPEACAATIKNFLDGF